MIFQSLSSVSGKQGTTFVGDVDEDNMAWLVGKCFPRITLINAVSGSPDKPVRNQVKVTLGRASPCPSGCCIPPNTLCIWRRNSVLYNTYTFFFLMSCTLYYLYLHICLFHVSNGIIITLLGMLHIPKSNQIKSYQFYLYNPKSQSYCLSGFYSLYSEQQLLSFWVTLSSSDAHRQNLYSILFYSGITKTNIFQYILKPKQSVCRSLRNSSVLNFSFHIFGTAAFFLTMRLIVFAS